MKNRQKKAHNSSKFKKYHAKTQLIFYVGLFMLAILLIVLLFQYSNISEMKSPFRDATHVEILDECSLIMGNLVHQIRDEDDCGIRCHNECVMMNLDVKKFDFEMQNSSCSTCDCYCR